MWVRTNSEKCAALGASELQLFLDDPMSDPAVRRDEETRPTTVEHIKLLRNRLEATNKDQIDELRDYFESMTRNISRQLQLVGLGHSGGRSSGSTTDDAGRATAGRSERHPDQVVDADVERFLDDRFRDIDRRLETLVSSLGKRVGVMVDERMVTLEKKLDSVLARLKVITE